MKLSPLKICLSLALLLQDARGLGAPARHGPALRARPPPLPNRVSGFRERFEAISRESSGRNSEGEAPRRSSSRLVPPGAPPLPGRRNSGAGLSPRKSATFTLSDTTGQTVDQG